MDLSQLDVSKANNDYSDLKKIHISFFQNLEDSISYNSNIGIMSVSSASITCNCLGYKIITTHRPVAVDGNICAIEYNFLVEWKGEELSILRLYLKKNGVITKDVHGAVNFHDFDGIYIRDHILTVVCSSLLVSPVFMPIED